MNISEDNNNEIFGTEHYSDNHVNEEYDAEHYFKDNGSVKNNIFKSDVTNEKASTDYEKSYFESDDPKNINQVNIAGKANGSDAAVDKKKIIIFCLAVIVVLFMISIIVVSVKKVKEKRREEIWNVPGDNEIVEFYSEPDAEYDNAADYNEFDEGDVNSDMNDVGNTSTKSSAKNANENAKSDVEIPDCVGLYESEAYELLNQAGLNYGICYGWDENYDYGKILSQSYRKGSVPEDSYVLLEFNNYEPENEPKEDTVEMIDAGPIGLYFDCTVQLCDASEFSELDKELFYVVEDPSIAYIDTDNILYPESVGNTVLYVMDYEGNIYVKHDIFVYEQ